MELKLLVAVGADLRGTAAGPPRATVIDADAVPEHASATPRPLPQRSVQPALPAPRRPTVPARLPTAALAPTRGYATRAGVPPFDVGLHVEGLPSVLDVTV